MVVDSKHQELTNEEIIQIAAQETGSPYSPEQVMASIVAEGQEPGTFMMREGNTILMAHRYEKDESIAVIRAINADTAQNYLNNSVMFKDALASMGFRAVITVFHDESLLNIFKYIGRDAGPGMGYKATRLPSGAIQVVAQIRSKNSGGLSANGGVS
jgi:hypothetical protein